MARRRGEDPDAVQTPSDELPPEHMAHLWWAFCDLRSVAADGAGPRPIHPRDLLDYAALTHYHLEPWQQELMFRLDTRYFALVVNFDETSAAEPQGESGG